MGFCGNSIDYALRNSLAFSAFSGSKIYSGFVGANTLFGFCGYNLRGVYSNRLKRNYDYRFTVGQFTLFFRRYRRTLYFDVINANCGYDATFNLPNRYHNLYHFNRAYSVNLIKGIWLVVDYSDNKSFRDALELMIVNSRTRDQRNDRYGIVILTICTIW